VSILTINSLFKYSKKKSKNFCPVLSELDGRNKKQILSCIFSEKVHFECEKVVPPKYIPPIEFLINARGVLEEFKNKKEVVTDLFFKIAYLFNERCNYNAMMEYVTI
jgi:hypothetical protein